MSFENLRFYATYEDAVGRTSNKGNEASLRQSAKILIYTYTSVISLLLSILRICLAIFQPFLIVSGALIAILISLIIHWQSYDSSNSITTFIRAYPVKELTELTKLVRDTVSHMCPWLFKNCSQLVLLTYV